MMVDWFRIVTELRGRGHSLETIAKHIGVHKTTVHGWVNGSTPNYMDGVALMDLWETTITQVPLTLSTRHRIGK
jgi:hypothetical protein